MSPSLPNAIENGSQIINSPLYWRTPDGRMYALSEEYPDL